MLTSYNQLPKLEWLYCGVTADQARLGSAGTVVQCIQQKLNYLLKWCGPAHVITDTLFTCKQYEELALITCLDGNAESLKLNGSIIMVLLKVATWLFIYAKKTCHGLAKWIFSHKKKVDLIHRATDF